MGVDKGLEGRAASAQQQLTKKVAKLVEGNVNVRPPFGRSRKGTEKILYRKITVPFVSSEG